jgi:glyoxylase-like metal-dependent hydrolase (beta-lactamase superfamily II)
MRYHLGCRIGEFPHLRRVSVRGKLLPFLSALAGLGLLLASTATSTAQVAQPLPQSLSEFVRVKPDVYAFRYLNHVSMFVVGTDGVLVVDPIGQANPQTPAVLKQVIQSVTDQPVKWLVYSHWGADHGTGGAVFADTASFVSQQNAAPKIEAAHDPTSPPPTITVQEQSTVDLGDKTVELHSLALSPEDDYLVVFEPSSKVVMVVDNVRVRSLPFGMLPAAPPERVTDRLQWIDDTFDFDVLVWGHGSGPTLLGTREDLRQHRQYYTDLVAAIRKARAAGVADGSDAMTEMVRSELAPAYGSWQNFPNGLAANITGALRWL